MYRVCDANDLGLLTEALERCWSPHFPGEAPLGPADLEALIRDIQLDPASSIVAFDGRAPIGVLLAAKRDAQVLVHRIAVHPSHLRQGHGKGLLSALFAKGGAARVLAEIPDDLVVPRALFERCGFEMDAALTDYELDPAAHSPGASGAPPDDSFLVAITLDDLLADPVLGGITAPCWERSEPTLLARKDGIAGVALAALNSIAALLLYRKLDAGRGTEILALRALDEEDGEAAAGCLLDATLRRIPKPLTFNRVHEAELPGAWLHTWGFRPKRRVLRYAVAPHG